MRRLKTYAAQTGYVYHYYYEGHRHFRAGGDSGTEFVFSISADRKTWRTGAVRLDQNALRGWESGNGRELSATERYAIAKMALFQAFDERPEPGRMTDEVRVRTADVAAIIETEKRRTGESFRTTVNRLVRRGAAADRRQAASRLPELPGRPILDLSLIHI